MLKDNASESSQSIVGNLIFICKSSGDHYSSDPVQVQSRKSYQGALSLVGCVKRNLRSLGSRGAAARAQHSDRQRRVALLPRGERAQMLGTEAPAKIGRVTLMRPIHGNL